MCFGDIFPGEECFLGEFSRENFTLVNLPENLFETLFIVLLSLCRINFTCGNVPWEIFSGVGIAQRIFSVWRSDLHEGEISDMI